MNIQDYKAIAKEVVGIVNREIEEEFYKRDWSKANVYIDSGNAINKDTIMASDILMIAKNEVADAVYGLAKNHVSDKEYLLSIARRKYRDIFNYYNYRWMIAKRAIAFYKKHEEVFKDSCNVSIDDLIEEGISKLIEIADKFDESKGYRFNTFLMTCIDNEFMEYSVRHSRFIRLTKKQNRTIAKVTKRMNELSDEGISQEKIMDIICKEFEITEYEIMNMLAINRLPASLDFGYDNVDGSEIYLGYVMPEDIDGPIEKRVDDALSNIKDTPSRDLEIYLKAYGYKDRPVLKKDLIREYGFKNRNELNSTLEKTRKSLSRELRPLFSDYLS